MAESARLGSAHLDSGAVPYVQSIRVGHHTLAADEPAAFGGADAGPAPYGLLAASLAACTSITLRMYADRKGWQLGLVHVDIAIARDGDTEHVERTLVFGAAVPADQRARLAEIAEKTPVTKTLMRAMSIVTTVA